LEAIMTQPGQCRFCGADLQHTFIDLGASPIANDYLSVSQLSQMEPFYPLHVKVCGKCLLVQVTDCISARHIFSDNYAYFSSFSDSWLAHAKAYVDMIAARLALGKQHHVVEVACNDGYLLQYFVARGIPVLGIEPTANTAAAAAKKGIPTVVKFLGEETARDLARGGRQADLLIGNNVLAHVPDINDFVEGLRILLQPTGVLTMEFPHLMRLMSENQFDTIYHEHYQYLSLMVTEKILGAHGLVVFDVEELPTHGGSLRIYARHAHDESKPRTQHVEELRQRELDAGYDHLKTYFSFTERAKETKRKLLEFLIAAKRSGKMVVGYGAPAKGNTLLNYCGVRTDFIDYTVDRSPHKQNLFLPGTRIPIHHPDKIRETRPDYVLILPWNIKDEIMEQMSFIREWGGQFVVPIPTVKVYPAPGGS
jgi:2-polyprenyl-3-methyl-5-hydroxy-6-metoxy-1,4-benzoquinol methylase